VIDLALLSLIVQRALPEHPCCQPRNRDPLSGFALSVTVVLGSKRALHVVPQLMPAGLLVIVPMPPSCSAVTVSSGGA
jgi:hypothetical protein